VKIKIKNQDKRKRELWKFRDRRERENEKGITFSLLIQYGRWGLQVYNFTCFSPF